MLEVLKCFIRGGQIFLLALCVCGGGVRFSTSPSVKKITDPPVILINDWSLCHLSFFKILLVIYLQS